ncbi:MAG: chloramphenicol phosphotransferase [Chloroflexota bacterium]
MSNIILINGASSAGKSTLANAFQKQVSVPFLRFSFDLFIDGDILPHDRIATNAFSWTEMRPSVMSGYLNCLQGLAQAGNNLVIDYIIETQASLEDLVHLLADFDVFLVGLHCALPELERREIARGNRRQGDAKYDLQMVHSFTGYDFELDSENPLEQNVATLIEAWQTRQSPSVFARLAK